MVAIKFEKIMIRLSIDRCEKKIIIRKYDLGKKFELKETKKLKTKELKKSLFFIGFEIRRCEDKIK